MRDSLTILAIALIIVLTAALVGPYLIDWSAERGWIEARLSGMLGARTQIRGAIDLKLLPSPYFVVEDIEIGGQGGGPAQGTDLSIRRMRLEIAPAALLRGEVDFVEARLDSPRLTLRMSPDGALPLAPPEASLSRRFRFEKIVIANGALRIDDAANKRSLNLDRIDLEAEAAALSGPFKGKGALGAPDARIPFRFATGPLEKGELGIKLGADGRGSRPGVELDGQLGLRPGAQRFAGAAKLESAAEPAWRAAASFALDQRQVALNDIELRIGAEPQALSVKGLARLDFAGAPQASATLASDEINLDINRDLWRAAAGRLTLTAFPPLPFTLSYAAKTLILGGAPFADVTADIVVGGRREGLAAAAKRDANPPGQSAAWLRLAARGPGKSRLLLDGQWRIGAETGFDGAAQASAEDARWLRAWLAPLAPRWTPDSIPFRAIDLSARTQLAPSALKLRDIVASIDGLRLTGSLDYQAGSGSARGRLTADLATPSIDLGKDSGFDARSLLSKAFGSGDVSLRLDAAALTLGGAGSLGGLDIDLARTGQKIELNQLTFEGVDGAVITASGILAQKNAHIDAKIVAPRADTLDALLSRLAPGAAADFLRSRAGALAPIDLSLAADAVETNAGFAVTALAAQGAIAGAAVEATVRDDSKQRGNVIVAAAARAKDSLPLLRLLGFAPPSASGSGAAQFEVAARGPLGGEAQTSIKAAIGPARLTFEGVAVANLAAPEAKGAFRFSTPDAAPVLRMTGLAFPDYAAKLPITAAGDIDWTKADVGLTNLKAEVAATGVAGALAFGDRTRRRLTGALDIERMSAAALFGLVLGAPEPAKAGSLWSGLAFAPAAFDLPNASVDLAVKELALPPNLSPRGLPAKNMRATLETATALLDLQNLDLDVGGGRLAGAVKVRRAAQEASIESHIDFADIALDGPSVRGRMSGAIDAAGTGTTPDAIAASFAGSGRAIIADLVIPKADPGALGRVFAAFDHDGQKLGARDLVPALAGELKHGDFKAGSIAFDLAVAAGQMRLSTPESTTPGGASLAATFDLRRAALAQTLAFILTPPPKEFAGKDQGGQPPRIALLWKGPFSNPAVEIDAAALANTLAARAILHAGARIESYEFEIHERAFFYERLRSERRREAERVGAAAKARKTQKAGD